jgi:hypothetical protein
MHFMICFCCAAEIPLARKVKIRWIAMTGLVAKIPRVPVLGGKAIELARFRASDVPGWQWTVVCPNCYRLLDNWTGMTEMGVRTFALAGVSRCDKASLIDDRKFLAWQQREARKQGIEVDNRG